MLRVYYSVRNVVLAIALLLAGMAFIASPASAHQGNITVQSKECVDSDTIKVTYRVSWSSVPTAAQNTHVFSRTGTTSFNGSWDDSAANAAAWATSDRGAVGSNSGNRTWTVELDKSQFGGSNQASGPWEYAYFPWTNGNTGSRFHDTRVENFDWASCVAQDAAAAVSTEAPTCERGEKLVYGALSNATFSGTANGTTGPGDYRVTATATAGHQFPGGSTTKSFSGRLAGPLGGDADGCAAQDAAAAVSSKAPTCDTGEKLVLGGTTFASWGTPSRTEGPGAYEVVATATSGHRFADGSKTKTFSGQLAGPLGDDADGCAAQDAAAAVSSKAPTCDTGEKLVLGSTTFASWGTPSRTEGPGAYEVVATATSGHRFADGSKTKTFSGRLAGPVDADTDACATPDAAAAVSTQAPTCDTGEKLVLGSTTFASWGTPSRTEGPGAYEVVATATSGHRFADGSRTETFSGRLAGPVDADTDACAAPDAAAAVSTTKPTCEIGETLVYGGIENATFSGTPDGTVGPGAYSVVANADSGHRFADGGRTKTFSGLLDGPLSVDDDRCATADAAAAVSQTAASCDSGEKLVLGSTTFATWGTPTRTEGPGAYEVVATALAGHRFDDQARTRTFTGELAGPIDADDDQCAELDAAAAVATAAPQCGVGETLVLADPTFASWGSPTLAEGPGDYEVVATADAGHRFDDGERTRTFTGTLAGPVPDLNGPDQEGCDIPEQPEPIQREVAGMEASCELGGVTTWVDVYTTAYVWNEETFAWELGEETGPVRTQEEFEEYTAQQYEDACVEVKGEEEDTDESDDETLPTVQVQGAQAQAQVPTAVDAGDGAASGPLGLGSSRSSLWMLAVVGGLGLMGFAGVRRRKVADR